MTLTTADVVRNHRTGANSEAPALQITSSSDQSRVPENIGGADLHPCD